MPSPKHFVVLVTAPDRKVARSLARLALEARVCACANLVPGIESHYWWKGKLESGREILVVFKTNRTQLAALEKLVMANHPYETAEFVALPIAHGSRRYLDWIDSSVG